MRTVAIITNKNKDTDGSITAKTSNLLSGNFNIIYDDGTSPENTAKVMKAADTAIIIGGDGTLLSAANHAAAEGVPILGINMGNMGFLADVELSELECALESFASGKYTIDERFMIEAVHTSPDGQSEPLTALNDIVISRASYGRMVAIEVIVDGHFVAAYDGDGVVIATPTGSTAYSLSAGGPVVDASLEVFIITPICPHTMSSKPLIVSGKSKIALRFKSTFGDKSTLTADGFAAEAMSHGDEILIRAADKKTKLIKVSERCFYQLLHKKLQG